VNRKEIYVLIGGLVVGLVVGIVVASFVPSSGTAAKIEAEYYLAKVTDVTPWLTGEYAESDEDIAVLSSAVEDLNGLSETLQIQTNFVDSRDAIDVVLAGVYGVLTGDPITDFASVSAAVEEEAAGPDEEKVSVCMGLDDDPYNLEGSQLYVYVAVPKDEAGSVDFPDAKNADDEDVWSKLEEPKTNELFWILLSCYTGLE
jgi:hypothetical protein